MSEDSRRFLLKKHRPAAAAEGARVVTKFEELVGEDTMRNEYLLHAIFHSWMVSPMTWDTPLDQLDERVYAELFLTPGSDPWLGLASPDTYLALESAGGG